VIQGLTIVLPSLANMHHGDPPVAGALQFARTDVHVLVRDNLFIVEPGTVSVPFPGGPTWQPHDVELRASSIPAIFVRDASNVTVADNRFVRVGGSWGAVALDNARATRVVDNVFEAAQRSAIRSLDSAATIAGNAIAVIQHDAIVAAAIDIRNPAGATIVERNSIHAAGSRANAIDVRSEGSGIPIAIRSNTIVSEGGGLYVNTIPAPALVHVADNTIRARACATVLFGPALIEGNALNGCETALRVGKVTVARTNTIDGRITYQSIGEDDVTLDGRVDDIGWIHVSDARRVTVRNLTIPANGAAGLHGDEVRIEGSAFNVPVFWTAGNMSIVETTNTRDTVILASRIEVDSSRFSGQYRGAYLSAHEAVIRSSVFEGPVRGAEVMCWPDGHVSLRDSVFSSPQRALRLHPCDAVETPGSSILGILEIAGEPTTPVDARGVWWGHPSGPRVTGNPGGSGSIIKGGPVLYDPWLTTAP